MHVPEGAIVFNCKLKMEGLLLNRWLRNGCLVFLGFALATCELSTVDYSSNIVGVYIVENAGYDGSYVDYSVLPPEEAWIIDIGSDNMLSYSNTINQCDSTYNIETREVDSITDTAIVFTDDSKMYYSVDDDQLLLISDTEVLTLVTYSETFPPISWTDPGQLKNDDYEPDSSLSLATRISAAGAVQSHFSAVCDDEDYFIFEALQGTAYIIEASTPAGSSLDLTISLFSATGDSVAYNDDQSTTNVDPELEWTCETTGDYYFIVKKYWDYLDPGNSLDDERGAYTASVDVTKGLIGKPDQDIKKRSRPSTALKSNNELFRYSLPLNSY